MGVVWHPWLSAANDRCRVEWYGEDGLALDAQGNEQYDASGNIILNGQTPEMQRIRYLNTTQQAVQSHVRWTAGGVDRSRDDPIPAGTLVFQEVNIPPNQRPDPANCHAWLDPMTAGASVPR